LRTLRGRQKHRESGGKRLRSLSKRQRHRESGGKQRVRWKTVEATTWEAETQRVR